MKSLEKMYTIVLIGKWWISIIHKELTQISYRKKSSRNKTNNMKLVFQRKNKYKCALNIWLLLFSSEVIPNSLQALGLQPISLVCLWDFPGKNTGTGCHFLLQGIFPIQRSKPHLLCLLLGRQILYHWATCEADKYIKILEKHSSPLNLLDCQKLKEGEYWTLWNTYLLHYWQDSKLSRLVLKIIGSLCFLSVVSDSAIPWTVAHQAPLCMECSRQEYWSGLPFPSPGDLPNPLIEPTSFMSPALAGESLPLVPPGKPVCENLKFTCENWSHYVTFRYLPYVNIYTNEQEWSSLHSFKKHSWRPSMCPSTIKRKTEL